MTIGQSSVTLDHDDEHDDRVDQTNDSITSDRMFPTDADHRDDAAAAADSKEDDVAR
jgi:hypothetical protein